MRTRGQRVPVIIGMVAAVVGVAACSQPLSLLDTCRAFQDLSNSNNMPERASDLASAEALDSVTPDPAAASEFERLISAYRQSAAADGGSTQELIDANNAVTEASEGMLDACRSVESN